MTMMMKTTKTTPPPPPQDICVTKVEDPLHLLKTLLAVQ